MERKSFKQILEEDISHTFMNMDEFAEIHNVNGKEMWVIVDSNEQIEREKRMSENPQKLGIHMKQLLIYVKRSDYGPLPSPGNFLTFDGQNYQVTDAIDESGIYSVSIMKVQRR